MNKKLVFGIAVTLVAVILLLFKVISIEQITDNWYIIGGALTNIYGWWIAADNISENKKLKALTKNNKK